MGDLIVITKILKNNNRIEYDYELNGLWKELIKGDQKFYAEYDCNIESVPDSIAVIPFLCNILPIAWIYDIGIYVKEIDKVFYDSIDKIKSGYINMYPAINFKGYIKAENLSEEKYETEKSAVLFSGGVDAFNTLIQNIKDKPDIITVWGADISLDDIKGWKIVDDSHKKTAKSLGLNYHSIKTNFRLFVEYEKLSDYIRMYVDGEWWHEIQHGIGIIGLAAPLSYMQKYGKVFIASSFTKEDIGNYTCASDPTIDNNLKYSNCITVHDGYEFNRQDKIRNICRYVKETGNKVSLRVCWESHGGKNCCICEKCCRTIIGILTEKQDPNDFGFEFNDNIRKKMIKKLKKHVKYGYKRRYEQTRKRFLSSYTVLDTPKDLMWFREVKMGNTKPKYLVFTEKVCGKFKSLVRKVIRSC